MKIKVKVPFYDDNGIHAVGDITDVPERTFDADRMEVLQSEPVDEKKEVKKVAKAKK